MTGHDADLTAEQLVDLLGLRPHPEGGCYVETYRAPAGPNGAAGGRGVAGGWPGGGRGVVTAIYFLLRDGERSHWHTVDAVVISDPAF